MFVVFENEQVQRGDQAVGGVAGDQIDLLVFQGAGQQAQVHDLRRAGEMQAVGGGKSFVAVGTLHEFVAETGAPLWSVRRGLRDGFQAEAASVVAANFDGESVVEAEWRAHGEVEALHIFRLDLVVDFFMIGAGLFFQDCGESGAGVFGIDIDAACENGLVANVSAGEIESGARREDEFGIRFAERSFLRE